MVPRTILSGRQGASCGRTWWSWNTKKLRIAHIPYNLIYFFLALLQSSGNLSFYQLTLAVKGQKGREWHLVRFFLASDQCGTAQILTWWSLVGLSQNISSRNCPAWTCRKGMYGGINFFFSKKMTFPGFWVSKSQAMLKQKKTHISIKASWDVKAK